MKEKLTLILVLILISLNGVKAQDTTVTWINTLGEIRDMDTAPYYRLGWRADGKWQVRIHLRSGPLVETGQYEDADCAFKSGEFIEYNDEGARISEVHYKASTFIDEYTTWYDDGTLHTKGQYSGNVPEEKTYSDDYWNPEEAAQIFPTEEEGIKVGRWEYYHPNEQLSALEEYDSDGYLISSEYWTPDGSKDNSPIRTINLPQFPGGVEALMDFLGNNIIYPSEDKRAGRSGEVLISFIVNRNGKAVDPQIERSASPSMDAECIRLVNIMPAWMPATGFNRKEEAIYFLPIRFTNFSPRGQKEMRRRFENTR